MLLSGPLGDVNPHHVHRQGNDCRSDGFAEAEQLGADIADGVDAALADATEIETSGPSVTRHRTLEVTLGDTQLTRLRKGREATVELVEWSIGPVRLVSVPGEAFQELGRAVEARVERDGGLVLLAGLAPEWHGYLPSPFTDGYEESMSYGRDAVQAIAAALVTDP
jgi:hypothetical protein